MERAGELAKGTTKRWLAETTAAGIDLQDLPKRLHKKKRSTTTMRKTAGLIYSLFIKHASVGTNSSTALTGVKPSKPPIGALKVPKRLVIGTARGFDPRASVDGFKNSK